jgi:3-oxoacyl-[acyl-carrier-protein] synthase-3
VTAVLDGIGTAVPRQVVTNDDLAQRLDTSDEWIRTRTGIAQRHIADASTATSDLAFEAAEALLKTAPGSQVGALIVATTTPDHLMPGVAPLVAGRLGLAVPAYDVQAVCSGFIYGLASAAGLIAAGIAERVMVIGAEVMSRIVDHDDRGTAVLFGDGAGAVTLRAGAPDELGAIGPFDLGSDGEHARQLFVETGGTRTPVVDADTQRRRFLTMDGKQVYRHAVRRMTESSQQLLDRAGLTVGDVDRFVAHQANLRILMAVADRLGIPPERRVSNVDRYGNTSAASIPLALADAGLRPGERVLLTAFGSGFTWGSTLMTWPDLQL